MNHLIAELKASIATIADPRDKEIARAMAILVSSLEVGPDVERLAQHTGFPRGIIQSIADNMANARLWIGGLVDDSEWWDKKGELDGVALFAHAQVALGSVVRKAMADCITYIDRETGRELFRWERTLQ